MKNFQRIRSGAVFSILVATIGLWQARSGEVEDLARLRSERTRAENALWIENALSARFNSSKRVVVADLSGPAVITMIHFAMPQTLKLNRDVLLKMYWDDEAEPSVVCPLVDFFCDPNGAREEVNTLLVNKRRGFNAYFPMPFARRAKIELDYGGPLSPGEELWKTMPCYSYVMYHTLPSWREDVGYFHAYWHQETLKLGERDYTALEAKGRGKFVGWNVTVRRPGRDDYPVDENEKFYIDGESTASVEFQGLEDSFGFSWGFPPTESIFPRTGFFKFMKGALAYRFFAEDAIGFEKTLTVAIGFGVNEDPSFRREFSKPGNALQFSSTVYWYQTEPHTPLPALPPAAERVPAPEIAFWPDREKVPTIAELQQRNVLLYVMCGRRTNEVLFAQSGYGFEVKKGYRYDGWGLPVYHCRADTEEVDLTLTVPEKASGVVRVYVIDPDNFEGGRKQEVLIGRHSSGLIERFQEGRWIEQPLSAEDTATGKVAIRAINRRKGSNAVISLIEWVGAEQTALAPS